jgi:ubiquinone biosynthesis protein UbiJ
MANAPGLFSLTLSSVLETLLNQALRLDEHQAQAFEPLHDRVIQLNLLDLRQTLFILFTEYGVQVQTHLQGEADAAIDTQIDALLQLKSTGTLKKAVVQGDTALAEAFIRALASLEIDWEEHLSHYTGDLIAFKIGHGLRTLLDTKEAIKHQAGDTLKEYLLFEINALPTRSQVTRFSQQVGQTQSAVDALEARLTALHNRLPPTH